jgi:S1-C subfamily serine protease
VSAILVDDPPPTPRLPVAVWVAATLVPLLNAWTWWRYAPADYELRRLFRAGACVLAILSLVALGMAIALVPQLWQTRPDWVENIASRADRSVVLVEAQPDSFGSGFVIASRGERHLVLTNRHVVAGAERCRVASRVSPAIGARVVGLPKDPQVDLALVVVRAPGLRPLGPIGRFRNVRVGEAVVAIGHPLGLDYTVTTGIVSAKRGGVELQTSAPISPGNSGGPLVDRRGRVIGVNTRTVNPVEGQSLGFATRADLVLDSEAWNFDEDIDDLLANIDR